ncbi:TIGR02678 family protein [Amycolatopsis taiwanensis]|uniref:TIGR02678 family protein n=1 Tax=Amycolatopsis taiwanensis TaxID=342230 RepID=UPI0004870FCA|nr:TIGR02678 family protein [Amycolatopsis taiwanensis]
MTDTAGGTQEHKAEGRRSAARVLLMNPMITVARHPEELALIRGHAPELRRAFSRLLGYQLVVESTFARLLKSPLSSDTIVRPAFAHNDKPFTARTYTYLSLVCASLLSPHTGEQILMSSLIEQVRADAVTAGVTVEDTGSERRHLVRAIGLLVDWGVLSETDGSVAGWEHRQEEALLDVHRPLLPHLLTRTLRDVDDPTHLLDGTDPATSEQPRRGLRRKLVENPLVRREDLPESERDVLSRERRELTRVLDEWFGLVLEARAEGLLAYDVDEELSDVRFPGTGTVAHTALLLLNALLDELRPTAENTVVADGRVVPGALAPWPLVSSTVELLVEQYGGTFAKQYSANADQLQSEVVDLLESVCLATSTDGGLVLHPACARYRPEPRRAPARTRALRRLETDDSYSLFPDTPLGDQETS